MKELASVNFHFWPYCDFNCKYCFAHFQNISKSLSKIECFEIIRILREYRAVKINFVGGEPTLCPFLGELIVYSKKLGLITSIVSNGTGITPKFLDKYGKAIDWIGLSLDSGIENIQKILGRGNGNYVKNTIKKCEMVKNAGINLKINSVITRLNYTEDISDTIMKLRPDRWKVFQVLEIKGQNSSSIKDLLITQKEFEQFIKRHEHLNPIVENNDAMIESYTMIDPIGRFYQNTGKKYYCSRPILEVGVLNALNDIKYNYAKFIERGGIYV